MSIKKNTKFLQNFLKFANIINFSKKTLALGFVFAFSFFPHGQYLFLGMDFSETIFGVESASATVLANTVPSTAMDGESVTTTISGVEVGSSVVIPGMVCTPNPVVHKSAHKTSDTNIQKLFKQALNGEKAINYIVAGDSTRDNSYNEMIEYYTSQLSKINITTFDDSRSGQKGRDWKNNVGGDSAISRSIAATPGTGKETILEFSFGINDYSEGSLADVKSWLQEGITLYLNAKPDASILLVTPVYTGNIQRNSDLQVMYRELANENHLPLVDVVAIMGAVHGNSDFYFDSTHPNKYGSRRLVNFILNSIIPNDVAQAVTLEEFPVVQNPQNIDELVSLLSPGVVPPNTNELITLISGGAPVPNTDELSLGVDAVKGYYEGSSGTSINNDDWRRLVEIAVEPGHKLRIEHQGNRMDIIWLDNTKAFLSKQSSSLVSGNLREIIIPAGAYFMRVNVSSEGAAYDALNDVPSVKYYQSPAVFTENGYYNVSDGVAINNSSWRRFPSIVVESGYKIKIKHQGNRTDVIWLDNAGTFISKQSSNQVPGELYRTVTVPVGAHTMNINVSSDGGTYDSLNDIPSIKYISTPDVYAESGYWSTSVGQEGSPVTYASWRRLPEISLEPNFVLKSEHQGNRVDIIFMDNNHNFISIGSFSHVAGKTYKTVTIPSGAYFGRMNISSEGATYDALNDVPSVKYLLSAGVILNVSEMNAGMTLNLPVHNGNVIVSEVVCSGVVGEAGLDGLNNSIEITFPSGQIDSTLETGLIVARAKGKSGKKSSGSGKGLSSKKVCKDSRAVNFNNVGQHDASLCKYSDRIGESKKEYVESAENKVCSLTQKLTQNMKVGDRNNKYSSWQREIIKEVKILQEHMNKLGFNTGGVDGILGPITDGAIKRMQKYLGTKADGLVGPKTRELINNSCK